MLEENYVPELEQHCSDDFDPQEVVHVMKWWLTSNHRRKRLAMAVGGLNEVIQEAYISLLKYPSRSCYKLSTIVVNRTNWTLARMCDRMCNRRNIDLIGLWPEVAVSDNISQDCNNKDLATRCWIIVDELLEKRIADIMRRRMCGDTFEQIGKTYLLSKERVRQLESNGIRILKYNDVLFLKFL